MLFSHSLLVVALSLAMLLIGINAQSGWLYWLAGLLLAALGTSWALSLFQVRKLSLVRRHEQEIGEGGSLRVTLEIHNHGRIARNLLEVIDEDPCSRSPHRKPRLKAQRKSVREYLQDPSPLRKPSPKEDGGRAAFLISRIDAGGKASITYQRGGLRRGVYEGWPGFFYSEGILGLARHTSRASAGSRLTVVPHYEELSSFPLVDSFLYPHRTALDYTSKKGMGIDYYGVREFRSGDPLRHVHWKTTARRGELVVKDFERETGTPLVVLVDNRVGSGFRDRGSALLDSEARLASSIAHYAHYAGHPVSLAAYRDEGVETYEIPGFPAALRWLASLEPAGNPDAGRQSGALWPQLFPGSFFCYITPGGSLYRGLPDTDLPHPCHVALVLVDPSSHNGNGYAGHAAPGAEGLACLLSDAPFPGLFSISVYRKGDDLRTCLEEPLIICGD